MFANRTKTIITALTAALCLAIGMSSLAGAAGPAKTTLSIIPQSDGFYGYVHSSKSKCESGRVVKVKKVSNGQKIGQDTSAPNGPDGMWNIGNPGHMGGKFYATTKATPGCKAATTNAVRMLPNN